MELYMYKLTQWGMVIVQLAFNKIVRLKTMYILALQTLCIVFESIRTNAKG